MSVNPIADPSTFLRTGGSLAYSPGLNPAGEVNHNLDLTLTPLDVGFESPIGLFKWAHVAADVQKLISTDKNYTVFSGRAGFMSDSKVFDLRFGVTSENQATFGAEFSFLDMQLIRIFGLDVEFPIGYQAIVDNGLRHYLNVGIRSFYAWDFCSTYGSR